jgi:hypothetical protein
MVDAAMRRPLLLPVVVLVLLVAAAGVIAVTSKPGLDNARDAVDQRWDALRAPLTARYERLGALVDALTRAGGPERAVTQALRESVARWQSIVATDHQPSPADEAASANELESLVARARANVAGSWRLKADAGVNQALSDVALVTPPAPDVTAYNRAVHAYERKLDHLPDSLVAGVLGFSSRRVLELS